MSIREGAAWKDARSEAREKAGHSCEACGHEAVEGETDDLQVHHIRAIQDGGTNDLDNLVVLCTSCHWQVHRHGPSEDGTYPVSLATGGSIDESDFTHQDPPLTPAKRAILAFLEPRGSVSRKEITSNLDYSGAYLDDKLRELRISGVVERVGYGLYELVGDPREDDD